MSECLSAFAPVLFAPILSYAFPCLKCNVTGHRAGQFGVSVIMNAVAKDALSSFGYS